MARIISYLRRVKNFDSFISLLKITLVQGSEKKAFHINGIDYTYHEFYLKVIGISQELLKESQSNKVIVDIYNDIETYASIIAIWLSGNTYIPLNNIENNERLASIITIVDADIILSSNPIKNDCFNDLKIINTKTLVHPNTDFPTTTFNENDIAYILFTSGTSGIPKGVPISYQNLNAFVDSFLSLGYSFSTADNFLQMADLTFDMSIISTLIPLCIGASISTINNDEIKYLATYKALSEQDVTVLVTAPSTLQLLKPYYAEINLEKLKYTFVGAEAFYETTANKWQKCAPNSQLINLYGPSEGGILSSVYQWDKNNITEHQGIVSIGMAVKNIELFIVDEQENIITNNDKGEAWILGNQVFDSYLDESMNTDKFGFISIDGNKVKCFKTGDIVFKDNNENLFYCGRKDMQVKIQGKRIELKEIEFYAHKITGKFHPTAIPFKSNFGIDQIALFIDEDIELKKLSVLLKENLPDYMFPTKIIGLAALPLNKNQKVDKKALAALIK